MAPKLPKRPKKEALEWLGTLFVFLVIFLLLRSFVAEAYVIRGSSMAPTLHENERLLLDKVTYHFKDIERGDIVVLVSPDDEDKRLIKRVIALGGEEVELKIGKVLINGKEIDEPYVPSSFKTRENRAPIRVQENHVFVMGDHRNDSKDSRMFGPVDEDAVIGKVMIRFWPIKKVHVF